MLPVCSGGGGVRASFLYFGVFFFLHHPTISSCPSFLLRAFVFRCSTTVECLPPVPSYLISQDVQPQTQKMHILIGPPLKHPPKYTILDDSVGNNSISGYASPGRSFFEERNLNCDGLDSFVVYCTSDFLTVSKKVYVRTRRVRLLGFEGAGKTSLFRALMAQARQRNNVNLDIIHPDVDAQEGVVGGICYLDSNGVNLQFAITSAIIMACTMSNIFRYSDKSVVFLYFFLFSLSALMLSFVISAFFSRAKTAVAVGTLSFLGAYIPYYTVNDPAVPLIWKMMASLLSPTAFALGTVNFADYERAHVGLRWTNVWQVAYVPVWKTVIKALKYHIHT